MDKYTKVSLLSVTLILACLTSLILFFSLQPRTELSVLGIETTPEIQEPSETMYSSEKLTFLYDHNRFELKEEEDRVILLPQNFTYFQYAVAREFEQESWLEQLKNSPLYPNLVEQTSESFDDYEIFLFSFDQLTFLNREESKKVYLTVYVKDLEEKTYIIEVRNFNYKKDKDVSDAFVRIINTMGDLPLQKDISQKVLGTTSGNDIARILGAASTVRVFARNCYDVNFTNRSDMAPKKLLGKTYTVCSATSGSGFVISSAGDVMTNAHVAKPHEFDSMVNGTSTSGEFETLMAEELIDYLRFLLGDLVVFLSQDEVESFYFVVLYELYNEGGFTMSEKSNQLFVQSDQSFDIDVKSQDLVNKDSHYPATLIKTNSINSFYHTVASIMESEEQNFEDLEEVSKSPKVEAGITDISDIAIFRFENLKRFPSLRISPYDPTQGQDVAVVGYPFLDADTMLVSQSSIQGSTVTNGSITNIKKNSKNTYDLIQIDASIESGNSGGPILNSEGDVLGMTTYSALSQSGNYNLGISSTELSRFVDELYITNTRNKESDILVSAISDISKDYHSRAKGKLDGLIQAEPALATSISNLVETAERNIEQGNDKSPWIDFGFVDIPNWGLLIIGFGVVAVFVLLLVLIIKKIGKGSPDEFEPMFQPSNNNSEEDMGYQTPPTAQPVSVPLAPEETLRPQAFIQEQGQPTQQQNQTQPQSNPVDSV